MKIFRGVAYLLVFVLLLSASLLLIPFGMIIVGNHYRKKAPRSMNKTVGYRTRRSMRSIETWLFAHKVWGKACRRAGAFLLFLPILPPIVYIFLLENNSRSFAIISAFVIGLLVIEMIVYYSTIAHTERALKERFDSDRI